jgi:hypothetical protein
VAAPALALATGCTGPQDLFVEGRVQRLVVDGPDWSRELTVLDTAAGQVELQLERGVEVATGTVLRVRGSFVDGEPSATGHPPFAVRDVEVQTPAPQALVVDPALAPPPRKLAVVLVNFKNDDRQPITVDEVRRRIFTGADSTRAFYREQSFGLIDLVGKTGPQGDVFGWYTIDAANRPCAVAAWGDAALAAAAKAGVDTAGYDHYVFFFPATDACPYLGLGQQPGNNTWINGASVATFTHELGHNVGTPHASARTCTGPDGQRVSLGGTCKDSEYGNPFDVMGAGFLHTNAYNKAQARWLSGGNVQVVGNDGVYTLLAQERPATGVQLLTVRRDESTFYYLEYRQPFGFDNFPADAAVAHGVTLLVAGSLRQFSNSYLLDLAPETTTLADAALGMGKSFEDRKAGVKMTVVGLGPDSAKVEFTFLPSSADAGATDGGREAGRPFEGGAESAGCHCALSGRPSRTGGLPLLALMVGFGLARRRRGAAALVIVVAALSGCGGDRWPAPRDGRALAGDASPDGSAPDRADGASPDVAIEAALPPEIDLYPVPAPVEEACRRYAEVYCGRLGECAPARVMTDFGSPALCQARRDQGCRTDFLAPSRNEMPTHRMACAQALATQICRDFLLGRALPACDAPPGALTAGAACFRSSQCGQGLLCKQEVDSCGTCQPALAVGADCGWWAGGCPAGTSCFDDLCLARRKRGEDCKKTPAPCEPGTECTAAGCADKIADRGVSCTAADLCDPTKGLYCNLTTGACEPLPAPVADGERCNTFDKNGAPVSCGPDATCFAPSSSVTAVRTCVASADVGQPCDLAMGKQCKVPATCAGGVCVVPMVVMGGTYKPPMCR